MRNLFAAILVALTVSTSSVSFAATNSKPDQGQKEQAVSALVTLSQMEKSKLDVVVQQATDPKMTIRLVDSFGNSIATKTLLVSQTGTRIRFDLASLADGEYLVKVYNGKNTQLKKFELKTMVPSVPNQELYIL